MATIDNDLNLWRAELAQWPPEARAEHWKLAAEMERAGWNPQAALFMAWRKMTEPRVVETATVPEAP